MSHKNQPRPCTVEGRYYASLSEFMRETGACWKRVRKLQRTGELVFVEARGTGPRPAMQRRTRVTERGAHGAARRILQAADTIHEVARLRTLDDAHADATRVEVYLRRMGLVKALWHFRKRFGVGVVEAAHAPR